MTERIRLLNQRPIRGGARYVLYWAQMNRRATYNHGLEFAARLANDLDLPVLFYEGLTCTYGYASDRFHTFLLEGVPETEAGLRRRGIGYVFYLRRRRSDPNDVLYRLAADAAAVVTDDYPVFIAARHNARVPGRIDVPYYAVDSSCVVPMNRIETKQYAAYAIRPKIRKLLPRYLQPFETVRLKRNWTGPVPSFHTPVTASNIGELVASCEIDHSVKPSLTWRGGALQAEKHLAHFLEKNLARYARLRNEPSAHATSNLSPYLHFGHISALEVALRARDFAAQHKLIAEEFLEELIVRRELAFNHARHARDPASLDEIPQWARETLRRHSGRRERQHIYSRGDFEQARTHDPLWNATQKELLLRGKIHGYYRMYWGKKIIEWSETPEQALETMIYLHDRYALDGRDPNTYANILWCFGLHDRPWPERPVFGTVRSMSFEGMKRKTNVEAYLQEIERLDATGEDPFRLQ